MDKSTVVGKTIEYGVVTPCSGFDRRPDVNGTQYVGDSKMETRSGSSKPGNSQSKKHKSSGKGQ